MTIIEKIVEIKSDRRLYMELEVPPELPVGQATLRLTLTSTEQPPSIKQPVNLQEATVLAGGAVALVRRWRDEWLEPSIEDGLVESEPTKIPTVDINLSFLPSSKELQTLRHHAKLKFQGKPFRM